MHGRLNVKYYSSVTFASCNFVTDAKRLVLCMSHTASLAKLLGLNSPSKAYRLT